MRTSTRPTRSILRTYRYGEADRIVVFLTEDRGKKRGVAKNATESRRRFGAALEPLTRGRVTYVEREDRELVRLDRIEPRRIAAAARRGRAAGRGGARAGARGVLRRAARRVGAGRRAERAAVPAGGGGGRGARRRRVGRGAGAVLRVLAAAARRRVSGDRRLSALRRAVLAAGAVLVVGRAGVRLRRLCATAAWRCRPTR